MAYMKAPFICLILALSLCSCSKELSRSKAQSLLNESEAFKSWKPDIQISAAKLATPACGGFTSQAVVYFYEYHGRPSERRELTTKGLQFFRSPACQLAYLGHGNCAFQTLLKKQVGEVSGITGSGESERSVDFKLQYEYPEEVLNCTGKFPEAAKATFRRYDDGWRVMKVGYSKPE